MCTTVSPKDRQTLRNSRLPSKDLIQNPQHEAVHTFTSPVLSQFPFANEWWRATSSAMKPCSSAPQLSRTFAAICPKLIVRMYPVNETCHLMTVVEVPNVPTQRWAEYTNSYRNGLLKIRNDTCTNSNDDDSGHRYKVTWLNRIREPPQRCQHWIWIVVSYIVVENERQHHCSHEQVAMGEYSFSNCSSQHSITHANFKSSEKPINQWKGRIMINVVMSNKCNI